MSQIVPTRAATTERRPADGDELKVGQWYWVREAENSEDSWLGCIVHLGTNYVALEGIADAVYGSIHTTRVHNEDFEKRCVREENPERVIQTNIDGHRRRVSELMAEIQRVTAALGLAPRQALPDKQGAQSQALAVVHGVADVEAHKKALVKAKDQTLPELFKKVEEEHKAMATWMKAQLIPMKAEVAGLKTVTAQLENRIFVVELYAGLVETLTLVKDGQPAPNDTKIHLFQRRHYMDEECLVAYEAGGMEFKDIRAFDKWLLKKSNLNRILGLPRCAVAFRVRRDTKEREVESLADFINLRGLIEADKKTFLYIRNGDRVYRLDTEIEFGEQLFPNRERSTLLGGGNLWMELGVDEVRKLISQSEYEEILRCREEERRRYKAELKKWKRTKKGVQPWEPDRHHFERYEPCTPDGVYYDDAMRKIARAATEHNRLAVVLQGLLDRSPAFHPHPPWRIFTPEGFAAGVELVYDDTNVLTHGDAPDFEAYRSKLNASLTVDCHTVGQEDAWERDEAKKEHIKNGWRYKGGFYSTHFRPYGNPGPGLVAKVVRVSRNGQCHFLWERERRTTKWVSNPQKPGWMKPDESTVNCHFACPQSVLLNVTAYTPGDFKLFYNDPRTRANYLKWAPLLLASEDFHAKAKK